MHTLKAYVANITASKKNIDGPFGCHGAVLWLRLDGLLRCMGGGGRRLRSRYGQGWRLRLSQV